MNSIFLHALAILNNSLESDYGRTHVRGKNVAPTDIGMMLMSMNLTKLSLEARRKAEAFQHRSVKNKKRDESITFMIIHCVFYI